MALPDDDIDIDEFLINDEAVAAEAGGFWNGLEQIFPLPNLFGGQNAPDQAAADQVGQRHIEQNPVQNPGQEPPMFQGLNVDNLQGAQNEVAQANEPPEYDPDQFLNKLMQEKEEILNIMLGMANRKTKPWRAYLSSQADQNNMQFLIELYAYTNQFVVGVTPPRHVKMACDMGTDPVACCWQRKFGAVVLEPDNVIRQRTLLHLFRVNITSALTEMFGRTNCKKTKNETYPEHVHYVMEDWIENRNNFAEELKNSYEEEDELAELTGLNNNAVRRYINRFKKRRYNFVTKQIEERPEPAFTNRRKIAERHASREDTATIVNCIHRYPGVSFKNLPREEQEELCRQVRCNMHKMLHWYRRLLRREILKANNA